MNKKRRLEKILDMLKIDGTITIKEIIDELDISDMTARRDLDALEADGLLTRTHVHNCFPLKSHLKRHISRRKV